MVFEHLQNLFDIKKLAKDFFQLILVCFYVAARHIPKSIVMTFGATKLLTLVQPFGSIRPIVISEILYLLVSKTFYF